MQTMKIKKGDTVQVLAGKDRGKQGRVIEALPSEQRVEASGEVVELAAQVRAVADAFAAGRALVPGEVARGSVVACLAAEQSLRENREIAL